MVVLHGFLPPRHDTHPTNAAAAVLLVGQYGRLRSMMVMVASTLFWSVKHKNIYPWFDGRWSISSPCSNLLRSPISPPFSVVLILLRPCTVVTSSLLCTLVLISTGHEQVSIRTTARGAHLVVERPSCRVDQIWYAHLDHSLI